MVIEAPLKRAGSGTPEEMTAMIEQFVKRLEYYVRKYPGHYINFTELRQRMAEQGDTPLFLPSDRRSIFP